MKHEKIGTTLTLAIALIEECEKVYGAIYGITNSSTAVICALVDFLLMPLSEQKLDTFAIHQLFADVRKRKAMKQLPIRIPEKLHNTIIALSGKKSVSETVSMMLSRTLYIASRQAHSAVPCSNLLYVWGNKSNPLMQDAINNIKDTAHATWDACIETCAGGLGIYSNIKFANMEILNDFDWNTANLYKAVQENPRELIMWARSLQVDTVTFEQQKNLLQSIKHSSKVDYEAASAYLFLNINSFKHKGGSPDNHMSNGKYQRALAAIFPLHQRLNQCTNPSGQVTQLCNADIFKVIEKYRKQENILFIVDPPYLDADLYNTRKSAFGEEKHARLANLLRLVRQNSGNDFIYFCRITAPKRYQNKPNTKAYNCHMRGCIDDLYHGHGFYYVDVKLDDTTTERIITSFSFNGATPYGCERGEK